MPRCTPLHEAALPALLQALSCRQYSKQYVPLEEQAHQARKGVWQGDFQMPADWRKQQRAGGPAVAPAVAQQPLQLQASLPGASRGGSQPPNPGCAIKGNISQSGEKGESAVPLSVLALFGVPSHGHAEHFPVTLPSVLQHDVWLTQCA